MAKLTKEQYQEMQRENYGYDSLSAEEKEKDEYDIDI